MIDASPTTILAAVAALTSVTVPAITGGRRTRLAVIARTLATAAIKAHIPFISVTEIGQIFYQDHSTIIYRLKNHTHLLATDPTYRRIWHQLQADIQS